MVRDINGLGYPTKTEARAGQKTPAAEPAAAQPASSPAGTSDEVNLSSEAQTLKTLEQKALNQPDVNLEKVERIKTALANNEFKIDDLIIADKLLGSDQLLGS